ADDGLELEVENAASEKPFRTFEGFDSVGHAKSCAPCLPTLTYIQLHALEASMFTKDHRGERRMPIDILLNKYIDGEPHTCRAVNISRGGVLLYKVFEPDCEHSEVSLEFQLPGSSRILRVDGIKLS